MDVLLIANVKEPTIINIETKKLFKSVTHASIGTKFTKLQVWRALNTDHFNRTPFRFIDKKAFVRTGVPLVKSDINS